LIRGRAGDDQANMQPRPKDPKFAKQTKTHLQKELKYFVFDKRLLKKH
jgi:hypothetical protein